jgi:hypothetical protein
MYSKKSIAVMLFLLIIKPVYAGNWFPFNKAYQPIDDVIQTDLPKIEDTLWLFLTSNYKGSFQSRASYTYQYIVLDENKYHVYGHCDLIDTEVARKQFQLVDDGGSCYFDIKYDSSNNSFFELWVNGEA